MSDIATLVIAIVNKGEWEALNGLVDALIEANRESEAVLLKRRRATWERQRKRAADPTEGHPYPDEQVQYVDRLFCDYIRERFPNVRIEDVPMWLIEGNISHAVANSGHGYVSTACLSVIFGAGRLCRKRTEGVCKKCRLALATMTLRPREEVTV